MFLSSPGWPKKFVKQGVALDNGELTLIALNEFDFSYGAFVTTHIAWADDIPFKAF